MTVNASIMTAQFTAHATDSFLTTEVNGSWTVIESQQTKIVRVPAFRGALTFYGLAKAGNWYALDWLRDRAYDAARYSTPEQFANGLAIDLTQSVTNLNISNSAALMGIHFSAYEKVSDYWIPEFFHIRNWINPPYSGGINPEGFFVTRETYATLKGLKDRPENHGDRQFRMEVHQSLHSGSLLYFNNGDPELFNRIANAIFETAAFLRQRKHLRQPADARFHLTLVRRPIEVISNILADLSSSGSRRIGGKLHDIAIAPDGTISSTTGD